LDILEEQIDKIKSTPNMPVVNSVSGADTLHSSPMGSDNFLWIKNTNNDFKGRTIGEYEVMGIIGEGGMGYVLSGIHPYIKKKVAIKILKPELSNNIQVMNRFLAEAQAVNAIGHPNIIDIFSFGTLEEGSNYFVMEYLDGETLGAYLEEGKIISYKAAHEILEDIFDALKATHSKGIVHRDLKPDNIFLLRRKGRFFTKLLDFGLAKFSEEGFVTTHTKTGMPVGTPLYMSPEQCMGTDVDTQSDIYSLGIILYRMFTGRVPFSGGSFLTIITAHMVQDPHPPSKISSISPELEKIILWCLEKDKKDRPKSVEVLEEKLFSVLNDALKNEKDPIKEKDFEEATIPVPKFNITQFSHSQSDSGNDFFKKAFFALLIFIFLGGAISVGAVFFFSNRKEKTDSPAESFTSVAALPKADFVPKEIVKPIVKPIVKLKKETIMVNLQIEPSASETKIYVNGIKQKKHFFKILKCEENEVELIVKSKGFLTWKQKIIPAFSQNISVSLKTRNSSGKTTPKKPKDDLPDVL
jgi:serine/threonine protein kinase